jgi:hypothetical protein
MSHEDEKFAAYLRGAAHDYNEPPAMSKAELDDMWSTIEEDAFGKRVFESPTLHIDRQRSTVGRWSSLRTLLPLAAVLILGIAIGRYGVPKRPATAAPDMASKSPAVGDSVAVPGPYQSTTSRYLGQTVALLATLPEEVRSGNRSDDRFVGRAHDLLLTTRLLLDSPAAADPRFRNLLDDLELVLAQIVRLQSDQSPAELDLIRQALEQRDVLPRLRTAVADISADN